MPPQSNAMHYLALVIGNSKYPKRADRLDNAENDANDVAEKLVGIGFTAYLHLDLEFLHFRAVLEAFSDQVTRYPDRTCVFFYAGHGLEFGGKNYLVPVDNDFTHRADLRKAVLVSDVMDFLYPTRSTGRVHNVIFLDCCRKFPSVKYMKSATALAKVRDVPHEGGASWVVCNACGPMQLALEGRPGGLSSHSFFTHHLLHHLDAVKQDQSVQDMIEKVKTDVHDDPAIRIEVEHERPVVWTDVNRARDDVYLVPPDATQQPQGFISELHYPIPVPPDPGPSPNPPKPNGRNGTIIYASIIVISVLFIIWGILFMTQPVISDASHDPSVPRQFVGHRALQATVLEWVRATHIVQPLAAKVIVLHAPAGYGKVTLARRLAYQILHDPLGGRGGGDGQHDETPPVFEVNLHGTQTSRSVSPIDAMRTLLMGLNAHIGSQEPIPHDNEGVKRHYRSRWRKRAVLVVKDVDWRNDAWTKLIVNTAGFVALVTSERDVSNAMHGAATHSVRVRNLTREESCTYLRDEVNMFPTDADSKTSPCTIDPGPDVFYNATHLSVLLEHIVELCDGVPRTLHLAAGSLNKRARYQNISPQQLMKWLEDQAPALRQADQAFFTASYLDLIVPAREWLHAMTLFPGAFSYDDGLAVLNSTVSCDVPTGHFSALLSGWNGWVIQPLLSLFMESTTSTASEDEHGMMQCERVFHELVWSKLLEPESSRSVVSSNAASVRNQFRVHDRVRELLHEVVEQDAISTHMTQWRVSYIHHCITQLEQAWALYHSPAHRAGLDVARGLKGNLLVLGDKEMTQALEVSNSTHPVFVRLVSMLDLLDAVFTPAERLRMVEPYLNSSSSCALMGVYGDSLMDLGNYTAAQPILEHASKHNKSNSGCSESGAASRLAALYERLGNYSTAADMLLRVAHIEAQRVPQPDPVRLAKALTDLAGIDFRQSRLDKAEKRFLRALNISEPVLGPDHVLVGEIINDLANVYMDQGNYIHAERLYCQAMNITKQAMGSNTGSVDLAATQHNLAKLYSIQRKYAEAEALFNSSLQMEEGIMGDDYVDLWVTLKNMAQMYSDQNQYGQAEPLFRRALNITVHGMGAEHVSVATVLHMYAKMHVEQGNYSRAEELFIRALEIREDNLERNHMDIRETVTQLASVYVNQGKHSLAEPLMQRILPHTSEAVGQTKWAEVMVKQKHQDEAVFQSAVNMFLHGQAQSTEALSGTEEPDPNHVPPSWSVVQRWIGGGIFLMIFVFVVLQWPLLLRLCYVRYVLC